MGYRRTRGEKSTVHSMGKGIKTTSEFMDKTWQILQQIKRELAMTKYMPYYREYLVFGEEIYATLSF
jgi:hypothetical protein